MSTNRRAKHFSLVVQLTTEKQEARNEQKTDDMDDAPAASTHGRCTANEVHLVDEKTLRLVACEKTTQPHIQIAYNMHFDVVYKASATDKLQLREVEYIMQSLFSLRQNSTLVRFATCAEQNISFLHNVLVTSVNKQLGELHLKLKHIDVSYYDLQQEHMVDMLQKDCHEALGHNDESARRAQACKRHDVDAPHYSYITANTMEYNSFFIPPKMHHAEACFRTGASGPVTHRFRSTWILLSWLLSNYRKSAVDGHEGLEVDFVVTRADDQSVSFSVTLTVLLVYFAKIQTDDRAHLTNYFKCGGLTNYVHTPLSMCLHEALKPGNNLRTLLLFDVPLKAPLTLRNTCALELLQLAQAIFVWRNSVVQYITTNAVHTLAEQTPLPPLRAIHPLAVPANSPLSPALKRLKDIMAGYKDIDRMFNVAFAETMRHCRHYYDMKAKRHCMAIAEGPYHVDANATKISPTTQISIDTRHDLNVALENLTKLEMDLKKGRYANPLIKYVQAKQEQLKQAKLKANLEFHLMFQEKAEQALCAELRQLESLHYEDYC